MKTIITVLLILSVVVNTSAQTTYTVSSNTNWSGNFPNNCNTCTFNIASGVTLTLNGNKTCYNCTINGGSVVLQTDFTFQQSAFNNTTIDLSGKTFNLQNNGTSFINTTVNASGSSLFAPSGSISISGSAFNFSGTAEFKNNGGALSISNSQLYFYGNSFLNVTAGPVNLNLNSRIVAGDGSVGSSAYLFFNGPALNLVDAGSAVAVANKNNYYYNWGSYSSQSNSVTYTTTNNNKNCGGTGQNSCKAQYYYGCASFGNLGPVSCSTLAGILSDFTIFNVGDLVKLNWTMSANADSYYFKVERSAEDGLFVPIGAFDAHDGPDYSFTDAMPESGNNKYRICIIHRDGQVSYSQILTFQNNITERISVFPNPVSGGRFFIQLPTIETVTMSVYTTDGQLLLIRTLAGRLKYDVALPKTQTRQLLVVRLVSKNRSDSFNMLNLP